MKIAFESPLINLNQTDLINCALGINTLRELSVKIVYDKIGRASCRERVCLDV